MTCRRVEHLVDALGLEPGAELRALEQRVLNQDPTLDWVPPVQLAGSVDGPGPSIAGTLAAALPALRSRVPVEVSTLVGRAFETDHVDVLLGEHRLVTLTGPGGVGKTVGWRSRWRAPPPTERTDVRDRARQRATRRRPRGGAGERPGRASGAGCRSARFGRRPARRRPGDDRPGHLRARPGRGGVDGVRLLRRTTALRILATSRRPLGVSGEVVWSVPALEVAETGAGTMATAGAADAARLFVERPAWSGPGSPLDDANAADIAGICRTLDGLPLAIEPPRHESTSCHRRGSPSGWSTACRS